MSDVSTTVEPTPNGASPQGTSVDDVAAFIMDDEPKPTQEAQPSADEPDLFGEPDPTPESADAQEEAAEAEPPSKEEPAEPEFDLFEDDVDNDSTDGNSDGSEDNPDVVNLPDSTKIPMKIDGVEQEVTIGALKEGHSFNEAARNRYQEHLALRNESGAQLVKNRQELLKFLAVVQEDLFANPIKHPSPELMHTDFQEWQYQKAQYDQAQLIIHQRKLAYAQKLEDIGNEIEEHKKERKISAQEAVIEAFPVLKDPKRGPAFQKMIREAAKHDYGITDQEFAAIDDPRYIQILADAARYRTLRKNGATKIEREKESTRTMRRKTAGTRLTARNRAANSARKRAQENGSIENIADFLVTDSGT